MGSPGTHSVCVCTIHQNVNLMLNAVYLDKSYHELLDMLVSDRNSKECMIHRCPDCPDPSKLFEYLTEQIIGYDEEDDAEGDIIDDNSEQISFQQWVSTDRSELITQTLSQKELIQTLEGKLSTLTAHSFISKEQARV